LASTFKDLSWDGRQYHSEAITQMYLGWNPFTETISPEIWDTTFAIWLNTLPKFPWILEFFSFLIFYDIEKVKYLSFLCIFILGIVAFQLIQNLISNLYIKVLFSILIALNPILISQSSSKYLDGFSGFWTTLLILITLFDFSTNSVKKNGNYMHMVSLTVMFVSILGIISKFSQILPILLLNLLFVHQNRYFFINLLNVVKIKFFTIPFIFLGVFLTIFLFINPFLNNLIKYGNVFYPMSSKNYLGFVGLGANNYLDKDFGLSDLIYPPHTPQVLSSNPWFVRPFLSLFLQPAHASSTVPANFKSIITFSFSEYSYLGNPDGRVSAFGSLFALALVLALATYLLSKPTKKTIPIILIILISFSLTPYAWWFRYVSWFYLLPIVLLLATNLRNKYVITFGFMSVAVLTLNSALLIQEVIKFRIAEEIREMSNIQKFENILIVDHYWNGDRINKVLNGEKFVFDNLENSFYQNHVKFKYSGEELKIFFNCYRPQELKDSKHNKFETPYSKLVVPNYALKLNLDICDVETLAEIQSNEKFLRLKTVSSYFSN
jgi:hypothetical protein